MVSVQRALGYPGQAGHSPVVVRRGIVSHPPIIAVIDDDPAIREALEDLIVSLGYRPLLFASAEDFLAFPGRSAVGCMVVDIRMGGMTGLDLQARLNAQGKPSPMIFMTSYTDEATRS